MVCTTPDGTMFVGHPNNDGVELVSVIGNTFPFDPSTAIVAPLVSENGCVLAGP
jgi:hypothetical protein